METHFPVGEEYWHAIDSHIKGKIVKDIRDRLVIPDGAVYDKQALKRANKAWRHYRFSLKKEYYKPKEKTLDEMCSRVPPSGISSNNWIKLVKYWHSEKGKKDVNPMVEQLRLKYPTKSQLELENEDFEEIMYQDEIPDRPVCYGLGVKKGDIYGVRGVLRKEGYGKIQRKSVMDSFKEEMVALHKKMINLKRKKKS
ncbi:Basic phospholipase A2 Cdr-13 [Bienertia sinuspersici]